ncbi:uncharacterized protein LOC117745362 isoform X1 [Lates japonicus]
MFFKTAPVVVSEELMRQAEALIEPSSQLTPLRLCREACGLVTVEGEVMEQSTITKIQTSKEHSFMED